MDPFSLLYDVAKTIPGVRTIVRLVEILKDILCELKDATRTLKAAEDKVDSDSSVFEYICAALVSRNRQKRQGEGQAEEGEEGT